MFGRLPMYFVMEPIIQFLKLEFVVGFYDMTKRVLSGFGLGLLFRFKGGSFDVHVQDLFQIGSRFFDFCDFTSMFLVHLSERHGFFLGTVIVDELNGFHTLSLDIRGSFVVVIHDGGGQGPIRIFGLELTLVYDRLSDMGVHEIMGVVRNIM